MRKQDIHKIQFINRDISWLSFNERVLQEAQDPTVPLAERIRFLGIYSNNFDEFFRVRVATLTRLRDLHKGSSKSLRYDRIVNEIQTIVLKQQKSFSKIWNELRKELKQEGIFFKTNYNINKEQKKFVEEYFDNEVRSYIIPLMIDGQKNLPYLRDKSIFLGIVMSHISVPENKNYALIEIPSRSIGRFVKLPSPEGKQHVILLEDIIRYNLPKIFFFLKCTTFLSHIFKVTKDAEMDIEEDVLEKVVSFEDKIKKALKARRKGRPVRFVYDAKMETSLRNLLIQKLNKYGKCNIIPGGRIHNFKHFMGFPEIVKIKDYSKRPAPFLIKTLRKNTEKIMDIIHRQDILLHFPYHSFNPVIDMLREAAMDYDVRTIKITLYRLATSSKVINAIINAARNNKKVFVVLELKARFDEEANLKWKEVLEQEGVIVHLGIPTMKIHAKLCLIEREKSGKIFKYGFVSTGNLHEKNAKIYSDNLLMTSDKRIVNDMENIFKAIDSWKEKGKDILGKCKEIITSPYHTRDIFLKYILYEIEQAKQGNRAKIIIKVNGLTDTKLIQYLIMASKYDVEIACIVRGVHRLQLLPWMEQKNFKAISIVDEYLEHSRIMYFYHGGEEKVFISSADWMHRNLDLRIEATIPIKESRLIQELKDILDIQLSDNVKARNLDATLSNTYVKKQDKQSKSIRAQIEIYSYLYNNKL